MITYEITGDKTTITDDNSYKSYLKLTKSIKIPAKQHIELKTGVIVTKDAKWDIFHINPGVSDSKYSVLILAEEEEISENQSEIVLDIFNPTDSDLRLPSKLTIAKLYKTIKYLDTYNNYDSFKPLLFRNNDIVIYSANDKIMNYNIEETPDSYTVKIIKDQEKEDLQ